MDNKVYVNRRTEELALKIKENVRKLKTNKLNELDISKIHEEIDSLVKEQDALLGL